MNSPSDDTANKSREGELEDWGGERRRNKRSRKEQDDEEREGNDEPMALVLVKDEETAVEDEETAVEDEETAVEDEEVVAHIVNMGLDVVTKLNMSQDAFGKVWSIASLRLRRELSLRRVLATPVLEIQQQLRESAEGFLEGQEKATKKFYRAYNLKIERQHHIKAPTQQTLSHLTEAVRKLAPDDMSWKKIKEQIGDENVYARIQNMIRTTKHAKSTHLTELLSWIYPGWRSVL